MLGTWPKHKSNLPEIVRQYWSVKHELSHCKNLILKENAISISKLLYRLHFTHCCINKTNLKAKGVIYWPNMYTQIENMINACGVYIKFSDNNAKEPLLPHPVPNLPSEKGGIDLFQDKICMLL